MTCPDPLKPAVAFAPVCKHCGRGKVNRPRGLCWSCYYTPGVKEMYPSTSKYARRGVGNGHGGNDAPAVPTTAAPGTTEKLAVLEGRAKDGRRLWHPFDAQYEGDDRPLRFTGERLDTLATTIVRGLIVSERTIYARPLAGGDAGRDRGRDVMLVVPGHLVYLTPAEAELLAGQLRDAATRVRAEGLDADGGE